MATATTTIRATSESPSRPSISFQELEPNRPHSSRPRPKHLQPLAIGQVIPRQRRHSGTYIRYPVTGNALNSQFPPSPSEETPSSATSLANPSLAAVRQYYKDNNLRTAFQDPQSPRAPLPTPASFNSRRSSIMTPTSLTARFDKLVASSPIRSPTLLRSPVLSRDQEPAGRTYRHRYIVDEARDMTLDGVRASEISQLGLVASSSASSPGVERRRPSYVHFVNSLPSKPPKDRLREFGHLYLGHILTSDVFVRALHIRKVEDGRRDSILSAHEDVDSHEMKVPKVGEDNEFFMLRARVIPCAKERKPFLIQRRMNRSDLKAMSAVNTVEQKKSKLREGEKENNHGRHKLPSRPLNLGGSPKSPRKVRKEQEQIRTLMPIRKPPPPYPRQVAPPFPSHPVSSCDVRSRC